MAGEAAGANQGAGAEHLSDGQSNGAGAPVAPKVINNANGSGDGVVPKDDAAAKAAADEAAKAAAAKATEADAGKEGDEEDDEPVVTEWAEWEDPSAAAAVDLLKEAGVTPTEADKIFAKAVESGDLRDIDVKELEAKVGKTKALLIMNGVKDYHQRVYVENAKHVSEVQAVFGGEQGWNTVKEWAQTREKSDPAFKKELDAIREDFNSGNARAIKGAANDLLALYNGSPNTKGLGNKKLVKGDGRPAAAGAPLSRADYLTELKAAHASGASGAVIAQLDARRMAGKKAGL
ncbi:scaffolding protein [Rhizobium phage Paso]|uniref:Scaffolding protein n=1 Tax=Rhizobium phage Paso TaxID=2767574 RepID=A0A7L8G4R3_9CAUD|nr:scaffolding protein [Rhizobium phage Paso]